MAQFSIYGVSVADVLKVLLGVGVTALYAVIRSRRSRLKWRASHQPLGSSTDAPGVGRIAITHNGEPITNLVLSTVVIENDYWRDFKDISICVKIQDAHQILRDEAVRGNEYKNLLWTQNYRNATEALQTRGAAGENTAGDGVVVRRDYSVPVLNRGDVITILLLVHAIPPAPPMCFVSAEAGAAVTVFQASTEIRIARTDVIRAFIVGMIFAYPLAELVLTYAPDKLRALLLITVGASITGIGASLIHAKRWLLRHVF